MTLRILVADDHELVARAIGELLRLEPAIAVVDIALTGTEAVRKAVELGPDVVLMDHFMPEMNGIEATRLIRRRRPEIRVLMVSASGSPELIAKALEAGATGFVSKSCKVSDLLEAIREVHQGKRYVQRTLADGLLDELLEAKPEHDPLKLLSARERQVLQMIVEGHTMSAIAEALFLSLKTVETYRARLMEKLGIRTLPGLVIFAIRQKLIPLE